MCDPVSNSSAKKCNNGVVLTWPKKRPVIHAYPSLYVCGTCTNGFFSSPISSIYSADVPVFIMSYGLTLLTESSLPT